MRRVRSRAVWDNGAVKDAYGLIWREVAEPKRPGSASLLETEAGIKLRHTFPKAEKHWRIQGAGILMGLYYLICLLLLSLCNST